ncbi:MAG: serine/threonine protein kinase, partial [Lachnospiraceae bacterium]|nr:serine/threonine protein kinase [Lachnospiraceae bacterium]
MTSNDLLEDILRSYEETDLPDDFSADFDILECLSERNGVITFLVRDKHGDDHIAKCFDTSVRTIPAGNEIISTLSHDGLPEHTADYENARMAVSVRRYVEGESLDRYVSANDLSEPQVVDICLQLCDILAYLHHRENPIIHRDIKPQNIIVRPNGRIVLIDFDIARLHNTESETDTVFFGTRSYAPPEQYGFSQTDERTDIYALGVLLRWLLTGSTKENNKIKIYRPLAAIIRKCTGFSPKERFSDVDQVKKALRSANPRSQRIRAAVIAVCIAAVAGLASFAGIKIYEYVTYTPFSKDAIPAYLTDEER